MRTADDLFDFIDKYPRTLAAWRSLGEDEVLPGLLAVAEVASATQVANAKAVEELWPIGRMWQDAIGVLVRWWADPLRPRHRRSTASDTRKAQTAHAAIDAALVWSELSAVAIGTRAGLYEFQPSGRGGDFHFVGEPRREALAHVLYTPTIPQLARAEDEMMYIATWFRGAQATSLLSMPNDVFQAMLRLARHMSDQIPRKLDPNTALPGFTLDEAHRLWDVVFGYAYVARFITMGTRSPDMAVLAPTLETLTLDLQRRTGLPKPAVASFVDFLTYRPGRHPDPAVSPFALVGDTLYISPTLVGMSNFERNLLRLLAYEPGLYGPVAEQVGRAGTTRVAAYFRTLNETVVATNVRVIDATGSTLGDLDVVVADRVTGRGAVFEVKWPAEPDSVEEGTKAELEIKKGQEQAFRLRKALGDGSGKARLPAGWMPFGDIEWDWFVLCGTHISSNQHILSHPIPSTSWKQIWHGPNDSLASLVTALGSTGSLPKEREDFALVWEELTVNGRVFRLQKIRLLS